MKTIFSIGHSNRKDDELVDLLKENNITDLVDVRTYPSSKYNPQFNRQNLENLLPARGIKYHWRGRNLGGLGGNVLFNETVQKMLDISNDERRLCVMCSEAKPEDCHRSQTIQPVVEKLGGQMVHILWRKKGEDGKMSEVQNKPQGSLFGDDGRSRSYPYNDD